MGVLGRRGAAGGAVQEADGGAAQVEGVGGEAAVALLGQEGGHVEREAGRGMRPWVAHQAHQARTAER